MLTSPSLLPFHDSQALVVFVPYNLDVLNLVQVGERILQNLVLPLEMRAQIIIVVRLVVAQVADVVLVGFMPTENVFL